MKRFQDPKITIRGNGDGQYYEIRPYVPRLGGEGFESVQQRISLGFTKDLTMRDARAAKQRIMAPINQGKFILQAQIKFSELVRQYREARIPKLGTATQRKYETHLENHILPVFGDADLKNIDRQSVEAWINAEKAKHKHGAAEYEGLGWWALGDIRNILSAIFSAAIDWKLWQGENPCSGVSLGRKSEKRTKRIPKAHDLQNFLAAIPETVILPASTARLVVLTAVTAGLRVSEVLGLAPEDIDVKLGTLTVVRRWHRGDFEDAKTESSRRVRQIGPLAEDLAWIGAGKEYIFEREGLPPDDRDLQQHVFRPAAEAVGIYFPGFGMHTLRRLNISWRQEAGATPFEAMKAAGHSKPQTTWLYTITDDSRERTHVEAILNRLIEPPERHTIGKPRAN